MTSPNYFLIFGNATIDHVVSKAQVKGHDKSIDVTFSDGQARRIIIEDGPFVSGKKHRVKDIDELIARFEGDYEKWGGGGDHNVAVAFANLRNKINFLQRSLV